MLQAFIRGLIKAGLETDHRDIDDILWLAQFLPATQMTYGAAVESRPQLEREKSGEPILKPGDKAPPPVTESTERRKVRVSTDAGRGVYVPQQAHGGAGGRRGRLIRVPSARPLPRIGEIARSLRPLMRPRPSLTRYELDVDASVENFAETRILTPALHPALERWFDLALIVDDTPSMAVWKPATRELYSLFARHGAFRDVRRWTLITKNDRIRIVGESGLVQDWREIIDPGRRLVLVVSDCAGQHWDAALIWQMLAAWGATSPAAIIQLLPERMWQTTAACEVSIEARARFPGIPNTGLEWRAPRWSPARKSQDVAIPIVALDPFATGQWARVVMGIGRAMVPAMVARPPAVPIEPEPDGLNAEQLVRRYKMFASVTAYRLAVYLSAVDLTFPVMRLVQDAMLPGTDQQYLAEFLLGGLVYRRTDVAPDVEYDFRDGVREVLRALLLESEALQILQSVSRFLEENYGRPLDIGALIQDPEGSQTISGNARPFATLAGEALKRTGAATAEDAPSPATVEEEEYAPGITIRATLSVGAVEEIAWSPNGSMFSLRQSDGMRTFLARSLQEVESLSRLGATAIAWVSDDVLACAAGGSVPVLHILSRTEQTTHPLTWALNDTVRSMRVLRGTNLFALVMNGGQVVYYEPGAPSARGGGVAPDTAQAISPDMQVGLAWSPDGHSLAIAYPGGKLVVDHSLGEVGDLTQVSSVVDPQYRSAACAWSSVGGLASIQSRSALTVSSGQPLDGRELPMDEPSSVSFSHDGAFLAARGPQSIVIWRTDTWQEVAHVSQPSGWTSSIEFSPNRLELMFNESQIVRILRFDRAALYRQSIVEKARESVLGIRPPQGSLASGFILGDEMYVLTPDYVFEVADVEFLTGYRAAASLLVRDPVRRISVLRIQPDGKSPPLTLAPADAAPGDQVILAGVWRDRNSLRMETVTGTVLSDDGSSLNVRFANPRTEMVGGPVLNQRAEVAGMLRSRQGNVYQCIPARTLREWVNELRRPDEDSIGDAFLREGKYEEAIDQYRQTIALNPNDASAHSNWGDALRSMQRFDDAIEHYQQAIQINPRAIDARIGLAQAFYYTGRLEDAVRAIRGALEIAPRSAKAYIWLGHASIQLGRTEEGIESYRTAIQINPRDVASYNDIGLVLANAGRIHEAIEYLQKAIDLDPNSAESHNNLSQVLRNAGRLDEAEAHQRRAVTPDLSSMRGIFISYRRDDSEGQSRRLYDDLVLRFGEGAVFMDVVGIEAGRDFRKVIDKNVGSCGVLLAVIGPSWLDSKDETGLRRLDNPMDFVRLETAAALKRDIPVVPVLVRGARMPKPEQLPDELKELAYRNGLELTHARWDSDVEVLIKALQPHLTDESQLANEKARADVLPVRSNYLLTGPLTIGAELKGPERQFVGDAYPTGGNGVHFVFDIFNRDAFDFSVHELDVDVLAYAPLNLDQLVHGVGNGNPGVRHSFRASIDPKPGRYAATYEHGGRRGEFVTIPPGKSEVFDVEISTQTEGLYDVCLRVRGGSAGEGFDLPLDSTKRRVAFFDKGANYMVDRGLGLGGRKLTYEEYSLELKSWGKSDYAYSSEAARERLIQALNDPKWEWRSLKELAIEAAVSEERAADILRADPRVRFGKSKSGAIVGLRARVGESAKKKALPPAKSAKKRPNKKKK